MKRADGKRFKGEWGPVQFWIAKRRLGSPPVQPATAEVVELLRFDPRLPGHLYEVRNDDEVKVRKGDVILGWGMIDRPPLELHVLSNGRGFVGLDVWGNNYAFSPDQQKSLPAIRAFDPHGVVIRRVFLRELFHDDELDLLFTTSGGTAWLGWSWLRDGKNELAILAMPGERGQTIRMVRFIDLESGKVRRVNIRE